jgi:hypothetical protein
VRQHHDHLRGPRRGNAPGLPDEIYFSVTQRKAIRPVDFPDLHPLAARILAFQDRYNSGSTPFDRTFTRTDLRALLDRMDMPDATMNPTAA